MTAKTAFVTPPCCARPSVANMDHRKISDDHTPHLMVNRMCLHCGAHWHGNDGVNVVSFTRAAWDKWISAAFGADIAQAKRAAA